MAKSLRTRIQLGQGLLLLTIVASLGTFVYLRIEFVTMGQIDTELEGAAQAFAASLAGLSPEEFDRGDFVLPLLLSERRLLPPPDRPPPRRPPPQQRHRDEAPLEVVIWRTDGSVVKRVGTDESSGLGDMSPPISSRSALIRGQAGKRQLFLAGPHGSIIMVGRSIQPELAGLALWRWLLAASGACAVGIGIVSGAWITRRALEPLARISAAAAQISATNLSERIVTQEIDLELTALATTLNETFERLEADFLRQARFTADASHELRTPLTVMLGHLDLALSQPDLPASAHEALTASRRAARRMKSLVEQLLLLARSDAGRLLPEREPFNFNSLVEECADLLAPLAREKQVEVVVQSEPVEFIGDAQLIAQVVINLITNAIVHNRPGGTVRVDLALQSENLKFSVADTGPGIPPQALPHVFERFYRVDTARSRQTGGSGLGLAIAQSMVLAHEGQIHVHSQPEAGSTFVVQLPLPSQEQRHAEPSPSQRISSGTL